MIEPLVMADPISRVPPGSTLSVRAAAARSIVPPVLGGARVGPIVAVRVQWTRMSPSIFRVGVSGGGREGLAPPMNVRPPALMLRVAPSATVLSPPLMTREVKVLRPVIGPSGAGAPWTGGAGAGWA